MRIFTLGLVLLVACGGSESGTRDASIAEDGAIDGPPGVACGGRAGETCKPLEYCDFTDNNCGVADGAGVCKRRPDACPLNAAVIATPTCACDGRIYNGECEANSVGVDVNARGTCELAAGQFACGYLVCNLSREYCRREPHLTGPEGFTCVPLACTGTPDCACLSKERCGNACTGDATQGLTLTCAPGA